MTMIPYYIGRMMPLAVLGFVGIGAVAVQVWLCRQKYSLCGMILPILALFFMLDRAHVSLWGLRYAPLPTRAVVCAPTVALILVYCLCRGYGRRKAELRRMHIQDLG